MKHFPRLIGFAIVLANILDFTGLRIFRNPNGLIYSCTLATFLYIDVLTNKLQADWRNDLEAFRDVSERDKEHYGFLLHWFDGWRLRMNLEPRRDASVKFWQEQVRSKERKSWQLEKWAEAFRWLYLCAFDRFF